MDLQFTRQLLEKQIGLQSFAQVLKSHSTSLACVTVALPDPILDPTLTNAGVMMNTQSLAALMRKTSSNAPKNEVYLARM